MRSTGLVLAAGGIAIANEVVFAPLAAETSTNANVALQAAQNFNWRIIPATVILAFTLGGLEKVSPTFGVGLAGLTLLAVLIIPVGKAATPIENVATFVTPKGN